jgi:hypothetical protein
MWPCPPSCDDLAACDLHKYNVLAARHRAFSMYFACSERLVESRRFLRCLHACRHIASLARVPQVIYCMMLTVHCLSYGSLFGSPSVNFSVFVRSFRTSLDISTNYYRHHLHATESLTGLQLLTWSRDTTTCMRSGGTYRVKKSHYWFCSQAVEFSPHHQTNFRKIRFNIILPYV